MESAGSDEDVKRIMVDDFASEATGVESSLRCHPGSVREQNQDCVGRVQTPLGELFLVLDGVGGRIGGAEASSLGLREYARFIAQADALGEPLDTLQRATLWVNQRIDEAKQSGAPEMQEMASTVALVLLHQGTAYLGHIGDSRIYRMREGTLDLLTRDHSVVQRMIAEGVITQEQAASHPSSHILTRSLGQPDAALELSYHEVRVGDLMLICSDGLWGYTSTDKIVKELAAPGASAASIADNLLEAALAGGGGDNISVVVLRVDVIAFRRLATGVQDAAPLVKPGTRLSSLYVVLAITVILASAAAVCLFLWRPWVF
jgi:serine/threonine protein phosphatase PrpC